MGYGPGAFGMGGFGHFLAALVGGLIGFFAFLVVVGLVFLLVRYLLAATKAANIYIAKNSPQAAPTTVTAPAQSTPAKPAAAGPATKPRAPKPPTA